MARPGEFQPVGLPRPGKVLRAILIGLLAIWVVFAIGLNWGGASPELFFLLCGSTDGILKGELWRLFTAPLMHYPKGTEGVWHILGTLLGLYFFAPSLERDWGKGRFVRFLVFTGLLAYGFQLALELALPTSIATKLVGEYWFGATPITTAVAIAWALSFKGRTVMLMFVLPVSSRGLILFVVGGAVLYTFAAAMPTSGLIAPFGGMLAGWLLGGGSPSPLRRLWLKMRLAQLDAEARRDSKAQKRRAARSGFKVIEGGRGRDSDPGNEDSSPGGRGNDGRWLN
jgi:membrane associated rhomboid family serine protease